ncbi:uncharacterized protein ACA1_060120 [Acanthamoeba castellanii str. Neff]|uniref:Uncharacterized protein n=1 Tax=Acanthamoeba castellanii (strain ATCC 30010 / Neff) TaxID=1257118 RepID=L8GWA6_ACACF|nr:uncharacterized protein ACA1_060120 [Acanthamoeba castellanii str. Neff]ELR17285.1 hypothetical protein ACA1_060120 [Acanthamoeba castellanii str. Neff]
MTFNSTRFYTFNVSILSATSFVQTGLWLESAHSPQYSVLMLQPKSCRASPCCGCNMIERNAEIYYGPDCNTMHLNGLETTFKRIF